MTTGRVVFISAVALVCSFLIMVGGCSTLISRSFGQDSDTTVFDEPHIGLVRIEGEIEESEKVIAQLEKMRENDKIYGVVVRVNSPGGSVASSQEINKAIQRLVADSIKVVASYGDVAASGGLYATLSAQKIFANEGTLTGSIGVIFQFPESKEMLDKIGLKFTTVKSGDYKDIGNPFRNSTEKDRAYLSEIIQDTYAQFFQEILAHRAITEEELKRIADGRIMTGRMADSVGLIDTLGTLQDALSWLKSECDLPQSAEVEEVIPKKKLIEQILDEPVAAFKNSLTKSNNKLLYMMN